MADFFDKMIATVSTGSKTMVEKSKINAANKALEDEKKQLLEVLGNTVFNYMQEHAEGDIPRMEVVPLCNEIISRNYQIMENKKKVEELDAEMEKVKGAGASNIPTVCPCGLTNAPGAKFCARCGNKLG